MTHLSRTSVGAMSLLQGSSSSLLESIAGEASSSPFGKQTTVNVMETRAIVSVDIGISVEIYWPYTRVFLPDSRPVRLPETLTEAHMSTGQHPWKIQAHSWWTWIS